MITGTLKVIAVLLCALFLAVLVKSVKSGAYVFILAAATVGVFMFVITQLKSVTDFISTISKSAGIDFKYIQIILKCIGICYLGDFASSICRDCGESALASNSELACKCSILALSLPLYADIFNMILKLWESV